MVIAAEHVPPRPLVGSGWPLLLLAVGLFLAAPAWAAEPAAPLPLRAPLLHPPADLRAETGMEAAVRQVRRQWPQTAGPIASELGLPQPAPVQVVLLSGATFRRWSRGILPEWGVGYARWPGGPVVIDMGGVAGGVKSLREVLAHELSHVYLGQRLAGVDVPRWFVEGVAQVQSGEWRLQDTLSLVAAAATGEMPYLDYLGADFPRGGGAAQLAYRVSLQAVLDLGHRLAAQGGWLALVDAAARSGDFDQSFRDLVGMSIADYAIGFQEQLRGRYGWLAVLANAGTIFAAMTLLFLLGVWRSFGRRRERLAEMEQEDRLGYPAELEEAEAAQQPPPRKKPPWITGRR